MLKQDVNELLTRTGPGTEMGDLFRRYWMPALLAEELPEDGCPPVRVKLLSERMIAFRDTEGRYGLMDEFCAHRGASLWFGRNEDGGLRCAVPRLEVRRDRRSASRCRRSRRTRSFCKNVKLTAYPLVKIGDVLWTYMGDPADAAAAAGVRVVPGPAGADVHVQAVAGVQLAAGAARAASTPATSRSCTRAA